MKNPLHYQLSEYDCGPTAMLDAISYLFDREEILPEIIRNVMLYCLDCYGSEGIPGKSGTSQSSHDVSEQLAQWLCEIRKPAVSSQYLSEKVFIWAVRVLLMMPCTEVALWWFGFILMNLIMCCSQVSMMVWWKCLTLIIGQNLLTNRIFYW